MFTYCIERTEWNGAERGSGVLYCAVLYSTVQCRQSNCSVGVAVGCARSKTIIIIRREGGREVETFNSRISTRRNNLIVRTSAKCRVASGC